MSNTLADLLLEPEDTYVYVLTGLTIPPDISGIVYIGITNDPKEREKQHREGTGGTKKKLFNSLKVVEGPMRRSTAELVESRKLIEHDDKYGNLPIENDNSQTRARLALALYGQH